jgi:hypothetical protein
MYTQLSSCTHSTNFRPGPAESGELDRLSGYTLRSEIDALLITREVLPETYFLLVIMAADAHDQA